MSTIHNVKQIIIGGFIAGGVALAAMGLGIGVAGAAGDGSVRVSDQAEHATGDGSVRVGHPGEHKAGDGSVSVARFRVPDIDRGDP